MNIGKRRRIWRALALVGGLLAVQPLLTGLALADVTIKSIVPSDLKVLDPVVSTGRLTVNHSYMIYDTLFAADSTGAIKPQMVDSYDISVDGLKYTFTLRPELKWNDGTPVTTADVVASLNRWSQVDNVGGAMVKAGAKFAAVDDKTFTITLDEPFPLVIYGLGKAANRVPFIMPKAVADTDPHTPTTSTIGSGPFMFKADEWVPGDHWVYVKNPYYIPRNEPADGLAGGKVVKVDRVEWVYLADQNAARAALQAGEVDYFEEPKMDFAPLFQQDPNVVVGKVGFLGQWQGWIRPNHLNPPFDNEKGRQALIYMTNQADYMKAIGAVPGLYYDFCGSYMLCGGENESTAGTDGVKQDYAKAAELLKEAGYKGEKLVIIQPMDVPTLKAAVSVAIRDLKKIGAKLDVVQVDWTDLQARRHLKVPADQGGWNLVVIQTPAADDYLPLTNLGITSSCDKAWDGWPCDPKMEELRAAWVKESDPAKRKQLIDEIQQEAYTNVPVALWGQFSQPPAYSSKLHGVIAAPGPVFWNISKDE